LRLDGSIPEHTHVGSQKVKEGREGGREGGRYLRSGTGLRLDGLVLEHTHVGS
jgi:hypothetical protein